MNNYFQKIPNDFLTTGSIEDWVNLKSDKIFSQYNGYSDCKITYHELTDIGNLKKMFKRSLFSILPLNVRFVIVDGKEDSGLPPHIDHNISVSLNYYINASNIDTTIFYEPKPNQAPYSYNDVFENVYNPVKDQEKIYKFTQVDEIERFNAVDDSAYILNVSKIHSVIKKSSIPRIFLSFLWKDHSYEEILKSLKI